MEQYIRHLPSGILTQALVPCSLSYIICINLSEVYSNYCYMSFDVAGGGATQLIMPYLYQAILNSNQPSFSAWRWAYFFPGGMQVACAALVLFGAQVHIEPKPLLSPRQHDLSCYIIW